MLPYNFHGEQILKFLFFLEAKLLQVNILCKQLEMSNLFIHAQQQNSGEVHSVHTYFCNDQVTRYNDNFLKFFYLSFYNLLILV